MRQPIHDKLVCFTAGKTQLLQGTFQKCSGILALYTKAFAHIILRVGFAFPVKIVISLSVFIGQCSVRRRRDDPSIAILRIGASQSAVKSKLNGDICFLFGIQINDRLICNKGFRLPIACLYSQHIRFHAFIFLVIIGVFIGAGDLISDTPLL